MIQPRRLSSCLHTIFVLGAWAVTILLLFETSAVVAEDVGTMEQMAREIEQLREMLVHQQAEINELRTNRPADTASLKQHKDMVRELVRETINDVNVRSQLLGDTLTAGYNKGVFIQSQDDAYKLKINTRLQFPPHRHRPVHTTHPGRSQGPIDGPQ